MSRINLTTQNPVIGPTWSLMKLVFKKFSRCMRNQDLCNYTYALCFRVRSFRCILCYRGIVFIALVAMSFYPPYENHWGSQDEVSYSPNNNMNSFFPIKTYKSQSGKGFSFFPINLNFKKRKSKVKYEKNYFF